MFRRLPLVLVLVVVLVPAAHASPIHLFGFGGRSPGLAATGTASDDSYEAVYLNPAGLAYAPTKRLSIGTLATDFGLDGVNRPSEPAYGMEIGGVLPIPLGGGMRGRVALGFGFYIPTDVLNRARAPGPGVPRFAVLENRARVVGVQLGLGARITDTVAVGAGFLALAALRGRIDVTTDSAGRFTSQSEQQLIAHYAPIMGARWRAAADLDTGLVLRFPSRSAYDILVTNDLAGALPLTLPEIRVAGVPQYDPLILAAEASWRATPCWRLAGQLAYERWSAFPLPTENPIASMAPQEPAGYHDTVVPRLAAEWTGRYASLDLALRGGYLFAWSPAPEQTGEQALLDNHRHVFSFGFGLAAPGATVPIHIDAWTQLHWLQPRNNDRPGDIPDVKTSGHIFAGGLVVGVDL